MSSKKKRLPKVLTVFKLYEMCMHMCSETLHVSLTSPPTVTPMDMFWVFFSSLCLLDEPSVQKFETAINKVLLFVPTQFLLEVSSFFLIAHAMLKVISENPFCLFWRAALFCRAIFRCHQTALSRSLFFHHPIVLLIQFTAYGSVCLSGLQRGFILTALILRAVTH